MPTKEVVKAFNHVKEIYPELSMVIFDIHGRWQYMNSNFKGFVFDETVDISILEDALDSVEDLPYIYQPEYEE